MKKMLLPTLLSLCMILLTSCQQKMAMQEYQLTFTMESENNYKTLLYLDQTGNYHIKTQNIYMDRHEDKNDPIITEGVLDAEALINIKNSIEESGVMQMEESYGFNNQDDEATASHIILFQLALTADGKEKVVTIRDNGKERFSSHFITLIEQLTTLIAEKEHKKSQ